MEAPKERKEIRSFTNADFTNQNGSFTLQEKLTTTVVSGISELFCEFATKQFKQYLVYCSGMGELHKRLTSLSKENQEFDFFLRKQLQNPLCRMMDLHSFLIMPMQRITRYPILLKELQKCVRHISVHYKIIGEAISRCEEILSMINQRAQIVQDIEKLVTITTQLYIPTKSSDKHEFTSISKSSNRGGISFENFDIVHKNRKLLCQGPFQITSHPNFGNYAYLFSDIMILSKTTNDNPPFTSVIRRVIDRQNIIIKEENVDGMIFLHYFLIITIYNLLTQTFSFSIRI